MPQLSDTMYSGKILAWRKNAGEVVKRGDILAEVETDKANLEIESFFDGTLLSVLVESGNVAKVGEVIAIIGQAGEKLADGAQKSASNAVQPSPNSSNGEARTASAAPAQPALPPETSGGTPTHRAATGLSSERIKVSPLAKKIAAERNIDLSRIHGSGPDGRIVRKDLESGPVQENTLSSMRSDARPVAATPSPANTPPPGSGNLRPFSKMRETIAKRMQQSVTEAPHFFTSTSVDMREALRLREKLKLKEEFKGISVNHLVIKAAAYALQNEPRVNFAVREGQVYEPAQINIGIITAIEDGLLIPVIKEANLLSLKDLVFEARAAVERARAGRPNSSDLTGGTFSISNMGMYDVDSFTAIINPGQGAVLAVSSTKERVIVGDGQMQVAPIMSVTLSVDHRIIDGIMSAHFLKYFKEALEMPALLM